MTGGTLIGIAVRPQRRAAMRLLKEVAADAREGLAGDHAGKHPNRLVSIIERESWRDACRSLSPSADPDDELPWTTRRANLLLSGLRIPRAAGAVLRIGEVTLETTGQTYPCSRMEEARPGLLKALAVDWRGGALCKVVTGGNIRIGDPAEIVHAPAERERRLP